jgi:hypothetical protein
VGATTDGFEGVHGGCGFGSRNAEGEMLLEFADAMDLTLANTWFTKKEGKLITFESGGDRTVVDYIMTRKQARKMVKNVTVIQGEPCLLQHKLLVCMLADEDIRHRTKKKKVFVSRCRVWRLNDDKTRQTFKLKFEERLHATPEDMNVETAWCSMRNCLLEVADEVCGRTKGGQRHRHSRETWWWNDNVAAVIKEKNRLYKVYKKSKQINDRNLWEEDKKKYEVAKRAAKKEVSKAQHVERLKFGEMLDKEEAKGNIFRVAKQMVKNNRDVVGGVCVKGTDGRIVVDDDKLMEVWKAHYEHLANEEFPWNKDSLTRCEATIGPCEEITVAEVKAAIKKAKSNKAAGPSGVVVDMLKAAGEAGAVWVTEICNLVLREGRIPEDWCKSWMVNVYKGKGDALECGSYRGIKLLEHVMKILERVIEAKVRRVCKIDDMQFGFMAGKGTTDAIFIVRQLQEKFLAKRKELWMAFVDLEKAFDRVPREVVWWALRTLGVDEWLVAVIKAMYVDATTMVRINGNMSGGFSIKVGVHQGSVLSPLLFIIVLEALSRKFRGGLPWELLYADDLVLMAETEDLLKEKIMKWKAGMEEKGLRVNIGKTKVMRCRVGAGEVLKSGKFPCGVCRKGVGANSIKCTSCKSWVHKKCSGISGRLSNVSDFHCAKCVRCSPVQSEKLKEISLGAESADIRLECVGKFCYLGDVVGAGGGAEEASRARVRSAWAKFRELAPILTSRGASLKIKGKVYKACVQTVLVYGSETWPMKTEDLKRLERAERMMVRWMCGVSLRDRRSSTELNERLGIEGVPEIVRRGRLRWFGHLERKNGEDWVSRCREFEVAGAKGRGRSRKTWSECVKTDLRSLGLKKEWAQDRMEWRRLVGGKRPTRASAETRTLNWK